MAATLRRSTDPSSATAFDVRDTEALRVESALPAHLLVLTAEVATKAGWELRPDMFAHLNVASARPFQNLDPFSVARLAKRTDEAAKALLFNMAEDHPCHGLAVAAAFACKLVAEGLFPDARNQAITASLLLIEDLKNEGAHYRYNEKLLMREAGRWLNKANLLGLYVKLQPVLVLPEN